MHTNVYRIVSHRRKILQLKRDKIAQKWWFQRIHSTNSLRDSGNHIAANDEANSSLYNLTICDILICSSSLIAYDEQLKTEFSGNDKKLNGFVRFVTQFSTSPSFICWLIVQKTWKNFLSLRERNFFSFFNFNFFFAFRLKQFNIIWLFVIWSSVSIHFNCDDCCRSMNVSLHKQVESVLFSSTKIALHKNSLTFFFLSPFSFSHQDLSNNVNFLAFLFSVIHSIISLQRDNFKSEKI